MKGGVLEYSSSVQYSSYQIGSSQKVARLGNERPTIPEYSSTKNFGSSYEIWKCIEDEMYYF